MNCPWERMEQWVYSEWKVFWQVKKSVHLGEKKIRKFNPGIRVILLQNKYWIYFYNFVRHAAAFSKCTFDAGLHLEGVPHATTIQTHCWGASIFSPLKVLPTKLYNQTVEASETVEHKIITEIRIATPHHLFSAQDKHMDHYSAHFLDGCYYLKHIYPLHFLGYFRHNFYSFFFSFLVMQYLF